MIEVLSLSLSEGLFFAWIRAKLHNFFDGTFARQTQTWHGLP